MSNELRWKDKQGDRFHIEPETTVADPDVVAGVLVGDHSTGEEAAVWITKDQAHLLIAWLQERIYA